MPRIPEDVSETIARLDERYPGREMLTIREVMVETGYKSQDAVRRHYPITNGKICKVKLARLMCL